MQLKQKINDWFRNLNLRQKLTALVASMTAFLIFVGFIGFFVSSLEEKRLESLYENNLLKADRIQGVMINTRANEANIYKLVLFPKDRNQIYADLERKTREWLGLLDQYSNSKLDSFEKSQIRIIDQDIGKYFDGRNKSINLIMGGKSKEGINLYKQVIPYLNDMNNRLRNLAEHNIKTAQKDFDDAVRLARTGNLLILGSILLAIPLAVSLLMLITSTISKPVKALAEKMKQVSSGNLDVEPAEIRYKNELGELNSSFNIMKDRIKDLIEQETIAGERESFLRNIILTSISTLQTNQVLKSVVIEAGKRLNAARCYFIRYDEDNNRFLPIQDFELYLSSVEHKDLTGKTIELQELEPFIKILLRQGQEVQINDASKIDLPERTKQFFEEYNIKSFIAAPVSFQNKPIGVLMADFDQISKQLSQDEANLFYAIANQSAIVVYQTRLFQEAQTARNRENLLRRLISRVRGSLDIDETFKLTSQEIARLFNAERITIAHYPDPRNLRNWCLAFDYINSAKMIPSEGLKLDPEGGVYWGEFIFNKGRIIAIDDISKSDVPEPVKSNCKALGITALTGIPIRKGEDIWGTLSICMSSPRHWTKDELELLQPISDQVYLAINQAELYSITKRSAETEQILRSINNEILTSTTFEDALQGIVSEAGMLFDTDRSAIRLFDPAGRTFSEIVAEYRKSESIPSSLSRALYPKELNDYIVEKVINNRQIITVRNIESSDMPEAFKEIMNNLNLKEIVITPLMYGDNPLGTLSFSNVNSKGAWNQTNLNFLTRLSQQISIGIHIFDLTNKLSRSLESERTVREIIFEARQQQDYDKVFDYLLQKLLEIFNVERVIHFQYDEERNLYVKNEKLINSELVSMFNKPLLLAQQTGELEPRSFGEVIIINDVNTELQDADLKNFLLSKNISLFMIYPKAREHPAFEKEKIAVTFMLCSSHPRIWTSNEVDSFKLTVDAASLVYLELRQRKETEETRNTFLATLTHDLRSPLNAEQKSLEAILSRKLGGSLDDFSEYLGDMYNTNQELLRIVNNILSVYHYEEGKYELNLQEVDIGELIENSVNAMRPLGKDQEMQISTKVQPDMPPAMADRDEILRVINNLLSNAIKHNTRGTTINISAQRINNEIQVCVRDNGKGIAEEERKNIFQRYPTTKRKIGTGLGLYLSKQIIDAHRGRIWFDSKVGKGTTFYFTLPVA